jgi:hypothetical protein
MILPRNNSQIKRVLNGFIGKRCISLSTVKCGITTSPSIKIRDYVRCDTNIENECRKKLDREPL